MKSWADHCSSDEESDDDHHPARRLEAIADDDGISFEDSAAGLEQNDSILDDDLEEFPPPPPEIDMRNLEIPPNAPDRPPFTAHVGNLAFTVKEPRDFAQAIEELVFTRYNGKLTVKVTDARIGTDRETGKRKGYGYIEFATVEELLILLNLNDGASEIAGRFIRLDFAQPPRRQRSNRNNNRNANESGGGIPDIDGSQFRSRRNNSGRGGNRGRGGDRGDRAEQEQQEQQPPRERPSLKLAPRTKPVEDNGSGGSGIFGGAKPREMNVNNRSVGEKGNDTGGRGGGGGGGRGERRGRGNRGEGSHRGGRGDRKNAGGRGKKQRGNRNNNNETAEGWDDDGAVDKITEPVALSSGSAALNEKKSVTQVKNSFAAFAFDSDSD